MIQIIKNNKDIIFLIIMMVAINQTMDYAHESVHKAIFRSYGLESEIHMKLFDNSYTIAYDNNNLCNENCILAHNLNEIVGYHLQAFLIGIISFAIIIYMFKKENDWENVY